MRALAKRVVGGILALQVKRLTKKNNFIVVGVVGSIGKTSTKLAIAEVLAQTKRVRYQQGNYNDYVSVPLVFFGSSMPSLFNPFAWTGVFLRHERQLRKPFPYEIVVVELGTDGPGQIAQFADYIALDIAVVTAITPEHMEYFADLDAVAKEELSVMRFSKQLVINKDLAAAEYRSLIPEAATYALKTEADYQVRNVKFQSNGAEFSFTVDGKKLFDASIPAVSDAQLYSAAAASAVADMLGVEPADVADALTHISPVDGRMSLLRGLNNAMIIDDSYNSSPEAAKAALETIYRMDAPQKIALLGNMNELGDHSAAAHTELGNFCDASQLATVVTLGPEANTYLAPAAKAAGCSVKECTTPYEAGEYIKSIMKENALILVKGSQNKVFAEEAIKVLLENPADANRLVRQSPDWLRIKQANFS